MQTLVDCRHHLSAFFQQRNRCTYRCILIAVAHLHVRDTGQPAASIGAETKQRKQGLAWLLVRQWHQRLTEFHTARINVSKLTRLQRHIIVHDPRALGLEACRQIHKRSCI